jgi:hypothetical protein
MRKPNAIPIPERHANKYFSYREAWVRIKKARGYGFYLEAITIEESIITDRLVSYLVRVGEIKPGAQIERQSLGQLIQCWIKRVSDPIPDKYFGDLRPAIDDWRRRRNRMIHAMVKSAPDADHGDVRAFLEEAELVAMQGEALARALTDWVRKTTRATKLSRG